MSIDAAIFVICQSEDRGDEIYFGPFEDEAWARVWIEQHNHDPWPDDARDEEADARANDYNHYCLNFNTLAADVGEHHEVSALIVPGFDPTTLPTYV